MLSNGDKIVAGKTTFVLETENNPAVTPPKASGVTEQAK